MRLIYLHGFASSPESSKGIRLCDSMRALSVETSIPDLNRPVFRTMTVTRMIEQTRDEIERSGDDEIVLVGSSLGAFVAVNTAALDSRVRGLVLLAPAFDFGGDEHGNLGTVSIADWKRAGTADVFHYAWNRLEPLDYGLYDDARAYDAFAVMLEIPMLIFQGSRDTVVDPDVVRRWAKDRTNVRLVIVDDDHQLHDSLDRICAETQEFVRKLRADRPRTSLSRRPV